MLVQKELLPTPAKSHYTFNLRDLSKVFQGVLMIKKKFCPEPEDLLKIWVHEETRVFRDRLIDEKDRIKFNELSHDSMENFLQMEWTLEDFNQTIFGDFETNDRKYIRLSKSSELIPRLDELLMVYNSDGDN
jgi:dynein heavy chain